MPRILPFKDPEPEEINGFKDITEAVNFLDIIIQCDGQSINNKEHFCFTHRTIEPHEERRAFAQFLYSSWLQRVRVSAVVG